MEPEVAVWTRMIGMFPANHPCNDKRQYSRQKMATTVTIADGLKSDHRNSNVSIEVVGAIQDM